MSRLTMGHENRIYILLDWARFVYPNHPNLKIYFRWLRIYRRWERDVVKSLRVSSDGDC
jgi:hypothetical protein